MSHKHFTETLKGLYESLTMCGLQNRKGKLGKFIGFILVFMSAASILVKKNIHDFHCIVHI